MYFTPSGPGLFPQESGVRSKRLLLNLSAVLNKKHLSTGTADRGYFQPFGQENRESQPAARDKEWRTRAGNKDERQRKGASHLLHSPAGPMQAQPTLSLSLPLKSVGDPRIRSMASIFALASSRATP